MGSDSDVKVPESGEGGHGLELPGRRFLIISGEELKICTRGGFKLPPPAALLAVKERKSAKPGMMTLGAGVKGRIGRD